MLRLEQMFVQTLVSWSQDDLGCKNCHAHFESNDKSVFKAISFFQSRTAFLKKEILSMITYLRNNSVGMDAS